MPRPAPRRWNGCHARWPNAAAARWARAFPAASLALSDELHLSTADDLRSQLASSRIRDAEAGRTLAGPHTTDLHVRHTAKRAEARDCSTGEQKALLISIMLADARELARAREGLAPILLLDEIAAHLDVMRRSALFEEIHSLDAQAWMTGTDLSLVRRRALPDLRSARGRVSPASRRAHQGELACQNPI